MLLLCVVAAVVTVRCLFLACVVVVRCCRLLCVVGVAEVCSCSRLLHVVACSLGIGVAVCLVLCWWRCLICCCRCSLLAFVG